MLKQGLIAAVLCVLSLLLTVQTRADEVDYLFLDSYLFGEDLQQTIDVISWDFCTFYLDMGQLGETLDLAVKYDEDSEKITGWLLAQNNIVDIDLKQNIGTVGDEAIALSAKQWRLLDGNLFVGVDALKQWFGINTDIRTGRLMVNFTTSKPHPRLQRLQRQKRYQQLLIRNQLKSQWPTVDNNWHSFTQPNLDFSWQQSSNSSTQLSMQGSMDLLWQSSVLNLSRNNHKSSGYFRLSRTLPVQWGEYYYQAGDIPALSHPFISTRSGRGFNWLASRQTNEQLLTRRFEGNGPPGWDVELYRGDVVVAWQEIGENGHYVFEDVPISFGDNDFTAKLYGPSGERQQQQFRFANHNLGVLPTQWRPEFSFIQNGKSLFFNQNDKQDQSFYSRINYGLNQQHVLRLGLLHLQTSALTEPLTTNKEQLVNFELRGFQSRHSYQINIGRAAEHQGYLLDISSIGKLTDQYDYSFRWRDTRALNAANGKQTTVGIARYQEQFEQSLNLVHQSVATGDVIDINASLGKRFELWGLSHGLSWQQNNEGSQGLGNFNINLNHENISGQFQGNYQWQHGFEWQNWSLSLRHKLFDYDWQWQLGQDTNSSSVDWRLNIGKAFEQFRVGLTLADNIHQGKSIALKLSTAINFNQSTPRLSHRSGRNNATIEAWAFIDNDFNGRLTKGDEPLPGVRFAGLNRWRNMATNKQGKVKLVTSGTQAQKINLDPDSLADPFLFTPNDKMAVSTHPGGKTLLQFPFYTTSEVEGEVKIWDLEQQAFVLRGAVPVQLVDKNNKVIAQARSEYDGYFTIDKLMPGQYLVTVKPQYLDSKAMKIKQKLTLEVNKNNAGQLIELPTLLLVPNAQT